MQAIVVCNEIALRIEHEEKPVYIPDGRFNFFADMPNEQVEDLILRLSNNAEIAWLQEQRE